MRPEDFKKDAFERAHEAGDIDLLLVMGDVVRRELVNVSVARYEVQADLDLMSKAFDVAQNAYVESRRERDRLTEHLRAISAVLRDDDGIGPGGVFQAIRHHAESALDVDHNCVLCDNSGSDESG